MTVAAIEQRKRPGGRDLAAVVARQQGSRSERPPVVDRLKAIEAKQRDLLAAINADPNLRGSPVLRAARRDASLKTTELWETLETIADHAIGRISDLEKTVAELRGEAKSDSAIAKVAPTPAPTPEGKRIELFLRGEVTRDRCDALIRKIKAASQHDEIVLRLTTPGGDHEASMDLCDALRERKGKVRTIAEGKCLSAGVTIFMSGDRDARLCTGDATFLIHKGCWESAPSAWRNTFNEGVESAQSDQLAKLFSRRTGRSWFSFRAMMRTDEGETLSAARAHELGIVSDILPARTRRSSNSKRKGKRK